MAPLSCLVVHDVLRHQLPTVFSHENQRLDDVIDVLLAGEPRDVDPAEARVWSLTHSREVKRAIKVCGSVLVVLEATREARLRALKERRVSSGNPSTSPHAFLRNYR